MKRPSFQFYPSDWLRDTALRTCSIGARGLWIDMICYMHEGNPYGYLKVGNKVILASNLSAMVGATLEQVEGWLHELSDAGVFDFEDGVICSRRMIRDENIRKIRAEGGSKGGNPMLKVKNKVNLEDKQKPTPSSSSSSSSSSLKNKETSVSCPSSVDPQIWNDWMIVRKDKKAKTLTLTGWNRFVNQVEKAGWTLEQAISHCCLKNWISFEASWIDEGKARVANKTENVMAGLTRGLVGGGNNVKLLGN